MVWQRLNLPTNILLLFCCCVADGNRGASDVEERMKQRFVTEFLHVGKNLPHWPSSVLAEHLWRLNSRSEHSAAFQAVVYFSSGDSDVKDKPHSGQLCTTATPQMKSVSISSAVRLIRLQPENCVWNQISTSMCWKPWWQCCNITGCARCPTNAHTGSERTLHANLAGFTEPIQGWKWQFPWLHRYWWQHVMSPLQAGVKMAVHREVRWRKFPTEEKSSRCIPQWVKWDALSILPQTILISSCIVPNEVFRLIALI